MDKKYISCLVNDKVGVCAISLVLDKRHVRNGGKYPIALRFTIDRKRLYYPLGDKYTEKEFDAICRAKNTGRRSNIKSEKETNFECKMLLEQTFKSYVDIVQDLDKTSKLSLNMIMTRLTGKNEEDSFLLVWEDIINNRSVGTADSYTTAKKSFIKYVGVISGFNVSKSTIEKWIKGMENDGFTKTTIGIYLRACRVVWNECTQRGFLSKNSATGQLEPSHDGWGEYVTNLNFYNSFDRGDKRHDWLIVDKVYDANDNVIASLDDKKLSYPFCRKFIDPHFVGDKTSTRPYLIRYSDIALTYAEAAGPTDKAYQLVNYIRSRSGLGDLQPNLSLEQFREAVLNERKFELAFEGNWCYDLRRWNRLHTDIESAKNQGLTADVMVFYPLPSIETDLNPNL